MAVNLDEPCVERLAVGADLGLHPPPGRRPERDALALAFDDQPHGDGLDPPRGPGTGEHAPEDLGHVEADEPVEDPTGLLGVDQVVIDVACLGERVADRDLGDLVEHHAAHRHGRAEQLEEVPGDRLALAVLVSGQQELVGVLEGLLQRPDLGGVGHDVERLEVVLGVDAQAAHLGVRDALRHLCRRRRQVPDVADRGEHRVAVAQEALDPPRLGRRLHDHEGAH